MAAADTTTLAAAPNTTAAAAAASPAPSIHEDVVEPTKAVDHQRLVAIAVDGSKYSEYAFQWALDNLLRPETDQIVLLNVRPSVPLPALYGTLYVDFSIEFDKLETANKTASHELIRSYAAKFPTDKHWNVRGVALRGDPRDELAYKVEDLKADILVIGSRGLGAFKRAIMGSVSDYLVHNLHIPVIVPKLPASQA